MYETRENNNDQSHKYYYEINAIKSGEYLVYHL